jgi:hypothetical protein
MDKKQLVKELEIMIIRATEEKKDYYAEGNGTDTYVMSLVGRIDGYKEAIELIKKVGA